MKIFKFLLIILIIVVTMLTLIYLVNPNYLRKFWTLLPTSQITTTDRNTFTGIIINSAKVKDGRLFMVYSGTERKVMKFETPLDYFVDNVVSVDKSDSQTDPIFMKNKSSSYISELRQGDLVRVIYKTDKDKRVVLSIKRNYTGLIDGFVIGKTATVSADRLSVLDGEKIYKFTKETDVLISSKIEEALLDNIVVGVPAPADKYQDFSQTISEGNVVSVSYTGKPEESAVARSVLILRR